MSDAALLSLIENYCREAGVRSLHKNIEKIYRKVYSQEFYIPNCWTRPVLEI